MQSSRSGNLQLARQGVMAAVALLTLTLIVPLAACVPAAVAADTTDKTIEVVQHNTDGLGTEHAVEEWSARHADAITFQEICKQDVASLREQGFNVYYKPIRTKAWTKNTERRCYNQTKGLAIATNHEIVWRGFRSTGRYIDPEIGPDGDQTRRSKVVCIGLGSEVGVKKVRVCTTHLGFDYARTSSGDEVRTAQMRKIMNWLNPWVAAGRHVIFTGDMNTKPLTKTIDLVHRVTKSNTVGTKKFWEADQAYNCDEPSNVCRKTGRMTTTDGTRKIDYWFASYRGAHRVEGLQFKISTPGEHPAGAEHDLEHDHKVLYGAVTWTR